MYSFTLNRVANHATFIQPDFIDHTQIAEKYSISKFKKHKIHGAGSPHNRTSTHLEFGLKCLLDFIIYYYTLLFSARYTLAFSKIVMASFIFIYNNEKSN